MPEDQPSSALSTTELAIVRLLATGATNREIARERGISEATVKKHVTNINNKLETGNRTEAVRRALELGLVSVPTAEHQAIDGEAARRLATELERARRRSKRWNQAFALAAFAFLVFVLLAFALNLDDQLRDRILPEPTATPVSVPTAAPPSAVWLPARDMPSARAGVALVADGSGVYAIGGEDSSGVLSDTLRYDSELITWQRMAEKPTPVRDAGAVAIGGEFLVPGGCDVSGRATDAVEIYDPRTDSWESAAPLPAPACGFALVEFGGRAYLFGGRPSAGAATALDSAWRYEPDADQWESLSRLPLPRTDLGAVTVGDRIHLLGGLDARGRPQTSHWVFSPREESDPWRTEGGPPLPEPRAGLVAASLVRNVYVVGGGWDRALEEPTILWQVDVADAEWQPFSAPRGPAPQRGLGLATFQGQWLYIAGGEAQGRQLDQAQSIRVAWSYVPPKRPR